MIEFRLVRYGDRAVLVELPGAAEVLGFRAAVLAQRHPALRSVVPAARTVLIEYDPALIEAGQLEALAGRYAAATSLRQQTGAEPVELAVRYTGADLHTVAAELGLSPEQVVARHLAAEYTVQFCGFSPGFGYLTGLDPALWLPRLATPRPAVPAGSVGIAGEYTGVYPRSSPGGWRLLGHTEASLFDLDRRPPALLAPGTRVRFVRR